MLNYLRSLSKGALAYLAVGGFVIGISTVDGYMGGHILTSTQKIWKAQGEKHVKGGTSYKHK